LQLAQQQPEINKEMIGKILIARAICVGNRGFRDRELAGYKAA
jgi:hypothetical protein